MELIFNAESLRPPITGVGVYSYHLLREFQAGDTIERVHCFTGTAWRDGEEQLAASLAAMADEGDAVGFTGRSIQGLRTAIGKLPGTKALYDHIMDRRFERYANDIGGVYHETNYLPKSHAGPCVITVHDLSHLRFPQFHKPDLVALLNKRLERAVAQAAHIITPSALVRDEVVQHFGVDASRVTPIYHGVEDAYRPREESECRPVLGDYGIDYKKYVLISATLEPRKGLDSLLDAWALMPESLRREYPLVLTGSGGWRNDALKRKMAPFREDGTLRHLGYIDARLLPPLFSGAAVFAYPSVYEGFGLPALDAMASGVPVLCRSGTSVAEFARGDVLQCEGASGEELAALLRPLLEHEENRQPWIERGLKRSAGFTWRDSAARTIDVYRSVL